MATLAPRKRRASLLAALFVVGLLGACSSEETAYPSTINKTKANSQSYYQSEEDSIFGPSGLNVFGEEEAPEGTGGGPGIGVNSYLWRASLDTISFMPLASADPFGGVIITDWYAPPETVQERFKVNLYILGRDLRADGVRAAVFRQRQDSWGTWVDAEVGQKTALDLENAILTRARQLRIAAAQ